MAPPTMTSTADTATVTTPAKLNLSLHVERRRSDGYHLLDSVVAPVTLFDRVTVRATPAPKATVDLRCTPLNAAPAGSDNLAVRAAALFLARSRCAWHVVIDLEKHIPAGAGLGGGSSDAAAVLRALNTLSAPAISSHELAAWALELGADVPLFLYGRPARMRGIGELLEPWPVPSDVPLVVAFSGNGMDTRSVYAKYDDLLTMEGSVSSIRPLSSGQEPLRLSMHNDLEVAAFHLQPSLRSLKQQLSALGAAGALMTGSGAAVFGVWSTWDEAQEAARQLRRTGTWARVVRLLQRVPPVALQCSAIR